MTKEEKICIVVETFLHNPNLTIADLANLPELQGISKSSIQRYLNDPVIAMLFDENVFNHIKNQLKLKGMEARKKGGLTSFRNNVAIKDEKGRFVGVERASDVNNIARKIKHILIFVQMFLEHPDFSLQDLADLYNNMHPDEVPVTRDYVYDRLSDHNKYELFSESMSLRIAYLLEQRRLMGNKNGADAVNEFRGRQ